VVWNARPAMQKWIGISKRLFNFCELKVHFIDLRSQDIFIDVWIFQDSRVEFTAARTTPHHTFIDPNSRRQATCRLNDYINAATLYSKSSSFFCR
jgi:hypothetical protein